MDDMKAIIDEINEEVKQDEIMQKLKKYKNSIFVGIAVLSIGIIGYSFWRQKNNDTLMDITNILLTSVQTPNSKTDGQLMYYLDYAPAEIKPLLNLLVRGKRMFLKLDSREDEAALIELSKKNGVDQVWKDLALLIYASYKIQNRNELINRIMPLTEVGRPLRLTALEMLGVAYSNLGNNTKALEIFNSILKDKEAAKTLKKRIGILANYIKNIGSK